MSSTNGTTEDASARWLTVHDELLRGITHALSNRIATVSASNYMFQNGDVQIGHVTETLRVESERMEKLLQQLRLLPARPDADAEPLTANDACAAAVQLHSHHSDLGDCPCDVAVDADVYPIWVEPQGFNHALLMAIHSAKRNASRHGAASGGRVSLKVSGDVRVVTFRAESVPTHDSLDEMNEHDAAAATWLLRKHGGVARTLNNGCEIEVPTLLAARKAQKGQ